MPNAKTSVERSEAPEAGGVAVERRCPSTETSDTRCLQTSKGKLASGGGGGRRRNRPPPAPRPPPRPRRRRRRHRRRRIRL